MIETIQHGQVAEIHFNNPPANAMGLEFLASLREAITALPETGAKAAYLTGKQGLFSAGLDVPNLVKLDRNGIRELWNQLFGLMWEMISSPVPLVAAIAGHAPAGGCVMSICCDYRIMASEEKYRIGISEVSVGIPLPPVIYQVMAHILGDHHAGRLCNTGALVSPQQAYHLGLVDQLEPLENVNEAAKKYAEMLASLSPFAYAETRNANRSDLLYAAPLPNAVEVEIEVEHWFHEETQANLSALVAKLGK